MIILIKPERLLALEYSSDIISGSYMGYDWHIKKATDKDKEYWHITEVDICFVYEGWKDGKRELNGASGNKLSAEQLVKHVIIAIDSNRVWKEKLRLRSLS